MEWTLKYVARGGVVGVTPQPASHPKPVYDEKGKTYKRVRVPGVAARPGIYVTPAGVAKAESGIELKDRG